MQINFKTSGSIVLTDELRTFAEKKAGKLEQLLDEHDTTTLADIELATAVGGQKTGDIYRAEITLQYAGGFVRAEAIRDSMHKAVDSMVAEARKELRRKVGRKRTLTRRGGAMVKKLFRRFKAGS